MPLRNMRNVTADDSKIIENTFIATAELMRYWTTFKFDTAQAGKRVLARPDSRGEALEGIIVRVLEYGIIVQYDAMSCTTELHDSGRWNTEFETTLDAILIEA